MKRAWFSTLAIGCVVGLLTLFLALQYKWLSEVSDAERERMQRRAETDVSRLAEDFNREMQAAYFNFQTDADVWKLADWDEFNVRYDFWKQRAAYPDLIREIYFFESKTGNEPLRYNVDRRSFEPAETGEQFENLRKRIVEDKGSRSVYEDVFAMALPIYGGNKRIEHIVVRRARSEMPPVVRLPENYGWIVIMLDEATIKNRLLPDLTGRYFPEGDYGVAVFDKGGQTVFATHPQTAPTADATASMFNMSADNLLFFANRDSFPRTPARVDHNLILSERIERHSFSRTESINGKPTNFNLELKQPAEKAKVRTSIVAPRSSGEEPWSLRVQHNAGSIDAFVRNERNKSFMLGLGIYLLLVGGIVAILLSAVRSRRFAQRQIDFVSSVSHEFRTPLAVIYSAGENLADGVAREDKQVSRYGELIKGEGKKLSAMVEQILEFAGAGSRSQKLSFAPANISEIVEDALSECRPLTESGGFTIETEIQKNMPELSVDRAALSRAIQNLVANSVKYSNGSKWIKLAAMNGGGTVKITVEDKGLGIANGELRQIFEPFYRAKDVVDAQISGNGLGLNLVKKIVEAHGGKISAESRLGSGSKFTIELPQRGS
jgi:signal transduction histidine kinase